VKVEAPSTIVKDSPVELRQRTLMEIALVGVKRKVLTGVPEELSPELEGTVTTAPALSL
jgi:ABC-type transporter Mla maintaining outer membrane lipid asymmetry ATPase subunit MlaF